MFIFWFRVSNFDFADGLFPQQKKKSSNIVISYSLCNVLLMYVLLYVFVFPNEGSGEDTRDICPPVKHMKLGEEEGSETHTKGWLVY